MDPELLKLSYGDHRITVEKRQDQFWRHYLVHVYCNECSAFSSGTFNQLDMSMNPNLLDEFANTVIQEFMDNYPVSCSDTVAQLIHES